VTEDRQTNRQTALQKNDHGEREPIIWAMGHGAWGRVRGPRGRAPARGQRWSWKLFVHFHTKKEPV